MKQSLGVPFSITCIYIVVVEHNYVETSDDKWNLANINRGSVNN